MLHSKAFIRKTRRGNVIKVVKEHWANNIQRVVLDSVRRGGPKHIQGTYYLVPDTNVFLNQIDVIEHESFQNVIVLQIVLEELRHRSIPIYTRVRTLISEATRRSSSRRETFIEREESESPNDRNDRACLWYNNHLPSGVTAVLLTDDVENRKKAQLMGVKALSVANYVESLTEYPELMDMLASPDSEELADKKVNFAEHLSQTQISAGLKSGAFCQGTLQISRHNFLEGSINAKIKGEERQIFIIGKANLNRGIQGDVVAVQVLPKSQWKNATETVVIEPEMEDESIALEGEQTTIADTITQTDAMETDDSNIDFTNVKMTAKIVGVIKRNWRPFCGTIEAEAGSAVGGAPGSIQNVFFWPMDSRIPKVKIRTRQAGQLRGKRIIVAIDSWPRNSQHPVGHFVRNLGEVGDRKTETDVLLLEHDVPHVPFSKQVLACLPTEGESWIVRDEHLPGRIDLRGIDVCSIDPPGCTDIDDALHARILPNGNYEVGVHIADVSHFVKPGNPMDDEAANRGTTVYLVDRRIDMLPSLLGTNLCSLRSNVDRLSFSCIWEITPSAEVVDVKYTKSVIRSRASLTYDEAQARLDDNTLTDPVSTGIKLLNKIAKQLRQKRMQNGALVLASPEVRFSLDNDAQDPIDVELKEMKDTNALVEEFMLLANIYVARKIFSVFPDSSMLRRHPKPPLTNFESLLRSAARKDITIDPSTNKSLSESLDRAVIPGDPYFNKLIRIMTTRCMMQAVYFCSGTLPEEEFWHYGLASDIYTHFTSPIRRYADLVVHRLLAACIGYDKTYAAELVDKVKISELTDVLNFRNRMAQQASRSSVELFTNLFFKNKNVQEDAYVIRVMKNGFTVILPKYGVEGVVHVRQQDEGEPILKYDVDNDSLVHPSGKGSIRIFDKVVVRLQVNEAGAAAAQRSKLVISLVQPVIPGLSIDPLPNGGDAPAEVEVAGKKVKAVQSSESQQPAKKAKKGKK
ncbi:exosome catalytic subunit dis3 [Blyttiomyces sp. JEL0837]|nr:exosome catalytic subunit dis3 [Blyttiomyces sp. JEL0837]